MAKGQTTANQTTAKSQEYVQDSSDEAAETSGTESESGITSISQSSIESRSGNARNSKNSTSSSSFERPSARKRGSQDLSANGERLKKMSKTDTPATVSSSPPPPKSPQSGTSSFRPPSGYESIEPAGSSLTSETRKMFSNTEGKQIWHITAPSSLPMKLISTLDIQAALRGEPILQHKGKKYNMLASLSKDENLLLPERNSGVYKRARADIAQTFHLREVSDSKSLANKSDSTKESTPAEHAGSESEQQESGFFATKVGKKPPVREQPKGLLMRYEPYGNSTTLGRPYRLPHPEVDGHDDMVDTSEVTLIAPIAEDNETHSPTKSKTKLKDGKVTKKNRLSHGDHVSKERHDSDRNGAEENSLSLRPNQSIMSPISEKQKKRRKERQART